MAEIVYTGITVPDVTAAQNLWPGWLGSQVIVSHEAQGSSLHSKLPSLINLSWDHAAHARSPQFCFVRLTDMSIDHKMFLTKG